MFFSPRLWHACRAESLFRWPTDFSFSISGSFSCSFEVRRPKGRSGANRLLVEITRADLAFDPEETQALAASVGYPISGEEVTRLIGELFKMSPAVLAKLKELLR